MSAEGYVVMYLITGCVAWIIRTVVVVAILHKRGGGTPIASGPVSNFMAVVFWPIEVAFLVWVLLRAASSVASAASTRKRMGIDP